ncbi:PEP/pyruvate-binding domain-containing protein [candidate division CSSED10-310 bacterium]|uniref:Phosphoenolpyruvate synthase n=1 Tax=candidate division CSSED10-310 bacterium TaxID=2855610 RepID=A0ABV6YS06_UNCC1
MPLFSSKSDQSPKKNIDDIFADVTYRIIREKFTHFQTLLEYNNQVLKTIADLEEKSQGEYLFDLNYIRSHFETLCDGVSNIVGRMIALGGDQYSGLKERYQAIERSIEQALTGRFIIEKDAFTIFFERIDQKKAHSVGSKNAQLGEMRTKLDLPVPEGFAISAWAYKHFVDQNNLQSRINQYIHAIDIKDCADLIQVSQEIQNLITSCAIPDDLAETIRRSYDELKKRSTATGFALRSSALGEDTQFSFAGQYATFLNIKDGQLLDRYREILASKFTPKAIYYFLSHSLSESDLAMSVSCLAMVDAHISGVIYTRDPVHPENDCVLVHSIYGLGRYLVDGILTPDVFWISRTQGQVVKQELACKPIKLVVDEQGGTREEPVQESAQTAPSLNNEQLALLSEIALKIEHHYGCPQDIEWAIDETGQLFLLQTRPLRIIEPETTAEEMDLSNLKVLFSGGTTICPGAGGGKVFPATSTQDLVNITKDNVLIAAQPFPGLITVMEQVKALVTEVGSTASHMATLAREYGVPTIVGLKNVRLLAEGTTVTVDATKGTIYEGLHPELIAARQVKSDLLEDEAIFTILKRVLSHISPLNILTPEDFSPPNCMTFHDITRFCHQKAMEEMFSTVTSMEHKERYSFSLTTSIPVPVEVIYLDRDISTSNKTEVISEENVTSLPLKAFWKGITQEGWPAPPPVAAKGFMSAITTHLITSKRSKVKENIFAIIGQEYMVINIRMGYHFTTVEAMCTADENKNYIRMLYKGGGAAITHRNRRINLIMEVLSPLGFEHSSTGDFLDTLLSYDSQEVIAEKLHLLGRLTMLTKQLDMALSSDSITHSFVQDFRKKLGLV